MKITAKYKDTSKDGKIITKNFRVERGLSTLFTMKAKWERKHPTCELVSETKVIIGE